MKSLASLIAGSLLLAGGTLAVAGDSAKYEAPDGFNGRQWGSPLAAFDKFGAEPLSVGAAWTRGKITDVSYNCVMTNPVMASAGDAQASTAGGGPQVASTSTETCDAANSRQRERVEGGGFHVLMEHRVESQGFRYGTEGVLMYPVVYQFCAKWDSVKKDLPPDFNERVKFCGMRLMFKGETDEELAALKGDALTKYDRVLDALIDRFGRPFHFEKRGRVVIEAMDGEGTIIGGERQYKTWRWCPPADRALATSCAASIVLAYDAQKRWGYVFYSTPSVWQYAYARENGDFKGDDLYRLLYSPENPAKAVSEARLTSTDKR